MKRLIDADELEKRLGDWVLSHYACTSGMLFNYTLGLIETMATQEDPEDDDRK